MAYESFKQMTADLSKRPGVTNPGGLAATMMRGKYTKAAITHAQKSGTSLRGKPTKKKRKSKAIAAFIKAPK